MLGIFPSLSWSWSLFALSYFTPFNWIFHWLKRSPVDFHILISIRHFSLIYLIYQ
jgi:hypothetical protein